MNGSCTAIPAAILSAVLCAGCASTPAADTPPNRPAEPVPAAPPAAPQEDVIIAALPAPDPALTEPAAYATPVEAEVVCTLERRTGSNRKFKVCRKPPSALDEAETQETFDTLRHLQMGEHR